MQRMMFINWSRLSSQGQALAKRFTLPILLLLLTIGCRPQRTIQETPAATFRSHSPAEATTQEMPPTPQTKSSSILDKAVVPTPTLHSQATPLHPQTTPLKLPTMAADQLEVVSYDEETLPTYKDSQIVETMATAVPPVKCNERLPGSDLLAVVTKDYGLSKESVPNDLVALAGHVPYSVTLGYPSEVRQVMLQPLVEMINDMLAEGLHPQVLSGYRSYAAQAISWNKWNNLYPERAAIISAQPGHSEHQLGTVIDFGSPELPGLVGQPGIQFHTYFYKTSEGAWLAENAHKYGFSLSFTEEAFDITGFYYEPWHFRYVGKIIAAQLREQRLTLTEYQLANEAPPCTP